MLNPNTVIFFSLITLIGCQPKSAQNQPMENMQENMQMETVTLVLGVEPLQLTMSERNTFKISISASNQGDKVIDPELHRVRLYINGKDSLIWNEAISNGLREAKWSALPPGEKVSMAWASMGESLFPAPGEFSLVLHYAGKTLMPRVIKIIAD